MSATMVAGRKGPGLRPAAISPADFAIIADFVRSRTGIVLGLDKAYLVEGRLEQILRSHGFTGLTEIAARLQARPNDTLAQEVIDAITTNETFFFRDSKPFEHLGRQALPTLHAAYPPAQPLRIWSAAASSGQEPYSIAMTVLAAAWLRTFLPNRSTAPGWACTQISRSEEGYPRRAWENIFVVLEMAGESPSRSGVL